MKIPVVFAVDQNYLFFACVAITSMAKSAEADTFYHIYILVDSDFADTEHLLEKTQRKYGNIRIETICVDARIFRNAVIHNVHLTKTTFYRLVLCSLLTEEKCLYLDADVIVTEDLTELYQTEIGENYIAGCRDVWIDCMPEQEREKRRKQTGIPSMRQYVNAGVLLLNLKQLRADGIERKFLEHLNQNYLHEDQDILNVCCYGKIMQLPAKWNLLTVLGADQGDLLEGLTLAIRN